MNYWKEHNALRLALMVILFAAGVILTFAGWSMTGKLAGMGLMMLGLALLLAALYLYNKPFQDPK